MLSLRNSQYAICWKEIRQLLPLVCVLIGAAFVTYVVATLASNDSMATFDWALLTGLPSLFAVGAGALVVGQEKEQRTLEWLTTLPIPFRMVFRTKLLVSLIGLLVVWLVSFGFAFLFRSQILYFSTADQSTLLELGAAVANTVFLLMAGFALAWRLNSSIWALVLLAPVALIPYAVAAVVTVAIDAHAMNPNDWFISPPPVFIPVQLFCTLLAVGAAVFWGRRAFAAARAPVNSNHVQGIAFSRQQILGPVQSQFRALLWQWYQQNRVLVVAVTVVTVFLCAVCGLSPNSELVSQGALSFVMFAVSCALGVSVFQSDDLQDRIRFMADRGISPKLTWVSRMLWPAALCILGITCICICLLQFQQQADWIRNTRTFWGNAGVILGGTIVGFTVSQWISQLIFSPIVAVVAAPAFSALGIAIGMFSWQSLGTPLWLVFSSTPILLGATALAMRDWMDRRKRLAFWGIHGAALLLVGGVNVLPITWTICFEPAMLGSVKQEIALELRQASGLGSSATPIELYVPMPGAFPADSRERDNEIEKASKFQNAHDLEGFCLTSIEKQLENEFGYIAPERVVEFLVTSLQMNRLRLDRMQLMAPPNAGAEETTDEPDNGEIVVSEASSALISPEDLRTRYEETFRVAWRVVERTRNEQHRLRDLDAADCLEVAMLKELLLRNAKSLLDEELYLGVRQTLANIERRRQGRKIALLRSINKDGENPSFFGGYVLSREGEATAIGRIKELRIRSKEFIEPLWLFATRPDDDSSEWRTRLADYLDCPPFVYGLGTGGRFYRGDLALVSPRLGNVPGYLWNATWEKEALRLLEDK